MKKNSSKKMIVDPMGQWKHPGKNTRIPGSNITMKGVNYPVLGVSNKGHEKMMYPGQEYIFPGADYVDEFPQLRKGGRTKGLIPMPKPSKTGLASKKYSRSLDATNRLFTENKLFKKPKSKKNKVFDPNAKYYQLGGLAKNNSNVYFNPAYDNSFTGGTNSYETYSDKFPVYKNQRSAVVGIEGSLGNRDIRSFAGKGWKYNAYAGLPHNAIKDKNYIPSAGIMLDYQNKPQDKKFSPQVQFAADYNSTDGLGVTGTGGARFPLIGHSSKLRPGTGGGHLDVYGGVRLGANKNNVTGGLIYGSRIQGKYQPRWLDKISRGSYFYGDAGIQFDPVKGKNSQEKTDQNIIGGTDPITGNVYQGTMLAKEPGTKWGATGTVNVGIKKDIDRIKFDNDKRTKKIQDIEDREKEYEKERPVKPVEQKEPEEQTEWIGEHPRWLKKGGSSNQYIELELSDAEIKKYVKGGYVVEDISVAPLRRAQTGLEQAPPKEELIQAPRALIKTDPNLDRDASRGEKIANYTPTEASYKSMDRPKSNFVPSEDASPEFINKLKSSGYYPVKSESGDYEVFSNKDISNLIYQKGMSPGELSEKLKLGDTKEIEKQFKPVYDSAGGMHAKRNKEKIDTLIKSGMSKDQAIGSLVKQGEGDVQGLSSMYGDYTEDAYQRQKAEADKLIGDKKQPGLNEEFEGFFAEQDKKRADEIAAMKEKIDYSGSLTPSETNINTANKSLGNFGRTGKDAYSANESLKAEVEGAYDTKTEEQKTRPVIRALLNSDLTDEQKKEYLNNPQAFEDLYNQHTEWDSGPAVRSATRILASGMGVPEESQRSDFKINPMTSTQLKLPAGLGQSSIFDKSKLPFYKESTINIANPSATWNKAADLKQSAPSGRVDMLDKEWIKGLYGATALPFASAAASSMLKAAPIASMPGLTAGNALTAKGVYDTATEYAPNLYGAIKEANTNEKGWTNDLIGKAVYSGTKGLLSGVLPLTGLKNISALKNAKTAFSAVDQGLPVATGSTDPLKHIKFLNAAHGISNMIKKSGGSSNKYIESELSQKEINDLIAQGYIIEELD